MQITFGRLARRSGVQLSCSFFPWHVYGYCRSLLWSFRKTGTMGTLAIHAEIGVWVQAPGALLQGFGGITHGKL